MKKKILIICGGLLSLVLVLGGVFNYYIKPKYVAPLVIAVEEFLLEDEETIELLLQEYGDDFAAEVVLGDEIEQAANEVLDPGQIDESVKPAKSGESSVEVDQAVESNQKENAVGEELESKQESGLQPAKPTEKKTVVAGKTMAELQKEVEPGDLKAGLRIASKIDTGHLLGLAKGGLTAEKKQEAKAHLTSRLTSSEISQLKGLVGKYANLLK